MSEPWSSLKTQTLSRPLSADEAAFADALEAIYRDGASDFASVARKLTEQAVVAPGSTRTAWDLALLKTELDAINQSLDDAYARHGIGA